jgi:cytochrome c biogenesis factor
MFLIRNISIQQTFYFVFTITITVLIAFVILIMIVGTHERKKENWTQSLWQRLIFKINALTFEGFYFDIKLKRNQIIRIRFW